MAYTILNNHGDIDNSRRLAPLPPEVHKVPVYARPSEGAEGANALGLKNAKPVPRDIFGFVKTGPRAIARGRGGD